MTINLSLIKPEGCEQFDFETPTASSSEEEDEYEQDPCEQYDDDDVYNLCQDCRYAKRVEEPTAKTKELLREKLIQMPIDTIRNLTQTKEDFLVSCSMFGKPCSAR